MTQTFPTMHRGQPRRRWGIALVLLCMSLLGSGCRSWMGSEFVVPEDFPANPAEASLAKTTDPADSLAAVFPPLPKLQAHGRVTFWRVWWPGKTYFDLDLLADTSGAGLYLRGRRTPKTLFELYQTGEHMDVVVEHDLFSGALDPASGSPFARKLGVEPFDLVEVLLLGQRLAEQELERKRGWFSERFIPADPTLARGLRWVKLDKESGLPSVACWEREIDGKARRFEVHYLSWARYRDEQGVVEECLLPNRMVLRKGAGAMRLRLVMERFYFDDALNDRAFGVPGHRDLESWPLGTFELWMEEML